MYYCGLIPLASMNSLKIITKAFYEICLLKRQPQDIPGSVVFFAMCTAAYTLSSFILTLAYQDFQKSVTVAFIDAGLTILITYLLLLAIRKPERNLQTCTALLGTGTIFSLLATPVYYLLAVPAVGQSGNPILSFLVWVLIVWNIAVMAHILKHALTVSYSMGVLVALMYIIIVSGTIINIAPEQPV